MEQSSAALEGAIKKTSLGVILSRISGMVRDVVLAFFFGTSVEIADFMVAYRFANLMRRILAETPLSSSFIPAFETQLHKSSKTACIFFRDLVATLACLVVGLTGLTMLGCLVLGSFLTHEQTKHILNLTVWMLPSVVFLALYGLFAAFLQCQKVFFLSSAAPIAFNGVWIAATLIMGLQGKLSLNLLAVSIVVGFIGQLLLLMPRSVYTLRQVLTWKEWCRPSVCDKALAPLMKPFFLTAIGVSTTQINAALDSVFAKMHDPSGPAYLWYAIRIEQVPLALFGVSASAAVLPLMSKALKQGYIDQALQTLQNALSKVTAMLTFSLGGLVSVGLFGLNLIFGRGEFHVSSLQPTYFCLLAYSAGLLFQGLALVLTSASYALEEFKQPMKISLVTICVHLLSNIILVQGLKLGPISVALSTSIAALLQMLLLIRNVKGGLSMDLKRMSLLAYLGIALLSALAASLVNYSLFEAIFLDKALLTFKQALLGCAYGGAVYGMVFLLLERACRLSEVMGFLKRKIA